MADRKRFPLNISLHAESRQRLTDLANRRQVNLSQVIEQLIDEAWDTEDHFMLKHAAMQSFVGAALAIATANRVLGKDDAGAIRREAASVARRLFGTAPTKRFDIRDGRETDARVEALFNAFERD
jgi:hypothetical protein